MAKRPFNEPTYVLKNNVIMVQLTPNVSAKMSITCPYYNHYKYWGRHAWASSVDPD